MGASLAVFASGAGTNAEALFKHFYFSAVKVKLLVCSNNEAAVLDKCDKYGVATYVWDVNDGVDGLIFELHKFRVSFIALAGFMKKIPVSLINEFPKRIINIHPSLLPKYGGKGFYGDGVHQAVIDNNEKETGITIHYVSAEYDKGNIIFQKSIPIACKGMTAAKLSEQVKSIEHYYYPREIARLIEKNK